MNLSKPTFVWVVEWMAFTYPNGQNTNCRRFFGTDRQAAVFTDELKAAAKLLGVEVCPTTETVEVQ